MYEVDVPAGYKLLQVTASQTGQFTLYVRHGDAPAVPSAVDCTASSTTLPAVCAIPNPLPGKAYVMVEGVSNDFTCNLRVDVLTK
ncbi:PPC domain-containing protein [Pyxidicoccus parkwayensis]|uniref:PPC domain-containing protein n=1 Tax=Pyxidicoccus parkwayensis TaxID=2813578 RepID=UPI001F50DF26|nr:PPC domain-containing protein [Pyxidicoccus parkwaysis]